MTNDKYLGGYADCYVLTENRSKEWVYRFLDRFLPERVVFQDEFEIPSFAKEPRIVFSTVDELLDYLEINIHESYSLYWKNLKNDTLPRAMSTFTSDGYLILGLSCKRKSRRTETNEFGVDWSIANEKLMKMKQFTGSAYGYITLEEPLPDKKVDFLQNCEDYEINRGKSGFG